MPRSKHRRETMFAATFTAAAILKGKVFVTYGWSLLLMVNWLRTLGLFYLRFGHFCLRCKLGLVFLTYSSLPSGN